MQCYENNILNDKTLDSRNYSHDVRPSSPTYTLADYAKRVSAVTVQILYFYPPLRWPISVAMGTVRVYNNLNTTAAETSFTNQAVAALALLGAVVQSQLGTAVTAFHDIIVEIEHIQNPDTSWEEVQTSLIKILNHSVYLALICRGGLELSILAFLLQAVINIIQAKDEFKRGRDIEGYVNLMLATVRFQQTYSQIQQLNQHWEAEAAVKKTGETQVLLAKSHFPTNESEAKEYAQDFIDKYHLPKDAEVSFNPSSHKVIVIWRGDANMDVFREQYPKQFHKDDCLLSPIEKAKFEFSEDNQISVETVHLGQMAPHSRPEFWVQRGGASEENDLLTIWITESFCAGNYRENISLYGW